MRVNCSQPRTVLAFLALAAAALAAATTATTHTCLASPTTAMQDLSVVDYGNCYTIAASRAELNALPNSPQLNCAAKTMPTQSKADWEASKPAGSAKLCHYNEVEWAPREAVFPACPHLSGQANCRFRKDGDKIVDYNDVVQEWICSMGHSLAMSPSSKCFAFIRNALCARFDSYAMESGFAFFDLQPSGGMAHLERLSICSEGDVCQFLNDECSSRGNDVDKIAPFDMCGKSRCRSDMNCRNWLFAPDHASCVETKALDEEPVYACVAVKDPCTSANCPGVCAAITEAAPPPYVTGSTGDSSSSSGAATSSPHRSPAPHHSSHTSGGTVFLIILAVIFGTFFLYCAVGIAYNRFSRGAVGVDQLPNANLWTAIAASLSGLVARLRPGRSSSAGFSQLSLDPPEYDFDA
ncbi:uncharacterized protein AMSG_10827 [Thecamonas trahens ATCC 50062]|uniref:Uncharacterized protein n=1 Tax=Thecamonas trahens ATCC 50062 TaxID=461836 RepID=A0A0L0DSF9_THETB|nr:hypothetical protein AMSG_10827 [Thecamonas trahens ATCC 50062]KNC55205.1 hypothetical protein AMSG_10827 [Thecamonas trahens ATCC 50062]|eukprot:XP_013753138.1 hypothetical protein AMSG_10827 [Thecamonas trahens ATCC 50062]